MFQKYKKNKLILVYILFISFLPSIYVFYKIFKPEPLINLAIRLSRKLDLSNKKKEILNFKNSDFDLNKIISINSREDYVQKKESIIKFLFKKNELPYELKPKIYRKNLDNNFPNAINIKRFEHIMKFGVDSKADYYQSKVRNKNLIIYATGHNKNVKDTNKKINYFLKKGYDILKIDMPLKVNNSRPTVFIENLGPLVIGHHDRFKFLEGKIEGHPLKFYIEPVIVFLNYLKSNNNYENVSMIGLSGGGWTTLVSSAIDKNINYSFIVSGPKPLMFKNPYDYDCYEISHKSFTALVNYFDLYIMSSLGSKNALIEIININEKNNFSHSLYEKHIVDSLNKIGKSYYAIQVDKKNFNHSLSDESLIYIVEKYLMHFLTYK